MIQNFATLIMDREPESCQQIKLEGIGSGPLIFTLQLIDGLYGFGLISYVDPSQRLCFEVSRTDHFIYYDLFYSVYVDWHLNKVFLGLRDGSHVFHCHIFELNFCFLVVSRFSFLP